MLTTLYKQLMKSTTPLLEAYLQRRTRRGKEDPARAGERRGIASRPRGDAPLVWFHAASVGESLSLLALITRLRVDHPALQVMVTTGTVTSAKLMAERLPPGAFHQYMPVDHPVWTERFLNHWRPNLVIWSESEFWPNMLAGIRARNIPAVLLNARMSENSFRRWQLARGLIGGVLKTFSLCLGQNEAEAARLKALGAKDARVAGNLKYAAKPLPSNPAELEKLQGLIGTRPHLLWASTHLGEEDLAMRLHAALKKAVPSLLTIIVPRHPIRGAEVAVLAQKHGVSAARRSTGGLPDAAQEIYIADTLGELGLFYRLSPLCIMGGSFVPVGGHNPIEPGQLGCCIFYGPHMFNFVTICHDFESRGAARRVAGGAALEEELMAALKDPARCAPLASAAKEWTEKQSHVVDETLALLSPYLAEAAA